MTTPQGKADITARAAARGVSVGEYIRRRIEDENDGQSDAEAADLAAIIDELVEAIPDMKTRLERTAALIEDAITDSDRRLRKAGVRA